MPQASSLTVDSQMLLLARVKGAPVTEGNMVAVGGKVFHRSAARLNAWREAVGWEAKAQYHDLPTENPVQVSLKFWLQRPKSHFDAHGLLRPTAPRIPESRPDIDKLVRAVLDALTGVVFADDSQVVRLIAEKWYAMPEHHSGVEVGVYELSAVIE